MTNNEFTDPGAGECSNSTGIVLTDNVGLNNIIITLDDSVEIFMNNAEF